MTPTLEATDAKSAPPLPRTLEATGLSLELVTQLVLKLIDASGELTAWQVSEQIGLDYAAFEASLDGLKMQRLVEIVGAAGVSALSYRYRITTLGRERAGEYLNRNRYVGIAPITIDQYRAYMATFQARTRPSRISPDRVHKALSHLVLRESVIDQLGAAVNSGQSLFVYGPPGNGKTVTSQALGNLFDEDLWIPHAIDVRGSTIQVYDPINHVVRPMAEEPPGLNSNGLFDRRWLRCRRPLVTVGGELSMDSLELSAAGHGFFRAPLQLVANGGVLVIDDFGRQRASPAALLNRWIAPLESRIDHLTLPSGQTVEVPFSVLVVFATNLRPADLLDEAFLRRIHYKVFLPNPTPAEFTRIFSDCCKQRDVPFDPSLVDYLLEQIYLPRGIAMRCCQPRDLLDHALAMARYLDQPQRLTKRLLDSACIGYFIDEPGVYARSNAAQHRTTPNEGPRQVEAAPRP